jgi:hypothetical protein
MGRATMRNMRAHRGEGGARSPSSSSRTSSSPTSGACGGNFTRRSSRSWSSCATPRIRSSSST